jgi:hypothetical protein
MNYRIFFLFLSLLLAFSLTTKAAAQTNDFNTQLKNVADKIRAKTVAWKTPEADLAPELKELDAIYAQHKGGNAEDLARVLIFRRLQETRCSLASSKRYFPAAVAEGDRWAAITPNLHI